MVPRRWRALQYALMEPRPDPRLRCAEPLYLLWTGSRIRACRLLKGIIQDDIDASCTGPDCR